MKTKATIGLILGVLLAMIPVSSLSSSAKTADGPEVVVLTSQNTIILNSEVNGESVSKVISQAKKLDLALSGLKERASGKKPLYLFLNSPGGSIQAGLELIEAMQGLDRKVNTITLFAASMGFQIAQNLDERLILKNGVLMSHHAAGEFQGQFGGVSPSQVDSRYQLWLDRVRELDEQTVKRTNGKQTYKSYTEAYDHEMWMTGAKSVAGGYADRIVTVKCDSSLSGVSAHSATFMGLPVQYELDNCPINTSPQGVHIGSEGSQGGPVDSKLTPEYVAHVKAEFLASFNLQKAKEIPMY